MKLVRDAINMDYSHGAPAFGQSLNGAALRMSSEQQDSDSWEMPLSAEYIAELNELIDAMYSRSNVGGKLSRLERAACEVYGVIGHLECDNLIQFWDAGYDAMEALSRSELSVNTRLQTHSSLPVGCKT
jgi:hypothetical protein